jgi:hypothetical protein
MAFLNNTIMIYPLMRQFSKDDFSKGMNQGTEEFASMLDSAILGTLMVNMIVMIGLNNIAAAFQNLQIIIFQTMINIQTPSNALNFLRLLKAIINAEFIEPEQST